jgi:hypothetical protein
MRPGRRVTLPIDILPRGQLAERMAIAIVLTMLLLLPFCALGIALILGGAVALHVYRSYDLGASLRSLIDRGLGWGRGGHVRRPVGVPNIASRQTT